MERLVNLDPSRVQWAKDAETMRRNLKDGLISDLPIR